MNREIKLRAYNFQDECFDYYDLNTAKGQGRLYNDYEKADIGEDGEIYCGTHSDLHLFTGLKDKNGVEIYKGDIVTSDYGLGNNNLNIDCEIVEWEDFYNYKANGMISENIKVIGNTYENPELLEEIENE